MASAARILAINPGSTSTKIACFAGDHPLLNSNLTHSAAELAAYPAINDQLSMREAAIERALAQAGIALDSLDAVVGRGGLLHPVAGGTYRVNALMLEDLHEGVLGQHASNLGGRLADRIARAAAGQTGREVPAFIVDPVVVDELEPIARVCGTALFERTSIFHALNQKAMARRAAAELGTRYEQCNLIVVHLGGGITVGAHKHGRVVDVNDGLNGDGPFTPERSGALPVLKVVDLCFSGRFTKDELKRAFKGQGGLVALLGTNDGREVSRRIDAGDERAELVYRAMAYHVAKQIGATAAALGGAPDAIVITGGLAHDARFVGWVTERVAFLGRVLVYPGEAEMEALAAGAARVLAGEEPAREYYGAKGDSGAAKDSGAEDIGGRV